MIVIASGYFDPIHSGHIQYLNLAKEYANKNYGRLLVIVNNDIQAILKKGKAFMSENDRLFLVRNLKPVDECLLSIDTDSTVCQTLATINGHFNYDGDKTPLVFVKGGDRFSGEIPESEVCKELGITVLDGFGDKIDSSRNYYDR